MLSIISPAKKLLATPRPSYKKSTSLRFLEQTLELVELLKSMNVAEISQLMGLSETLARLNFERYQDFSIDGSTKQPSANALFLFQGDVYQSLNASTLEDTAIEFAQKHLNILSGLYGLIRPLDLIQPYRLEMGTSLANSAGNNLYDYWQPTLTTHLNNELKKHQNPVLLNLASSEYCKAIKASALKYPMVNVHFKENKNGQLKTIGIHAKKARGAMARYIIENQLDDIDGVIRFKNLDYQYQKSLSDELNLVFSR